MSLVGLLVFVLVIVIIFWLLSQLPGVDPKLMMIIRVIVVIFALIYLLENLGMFSSPSLRLR